MKFKLTKEFRVGIIFVIATAILIWGLMYLKGMELFKHKMIIYAVYDKVNGREVVPAGAEADVFCSLAFVWSVCW